MRLSKRSRNSDGNVPNVKWNPDNGKVNVNWNYSDNRNSNLRSRQEVSVNNPDNVAGYLFAYARQPFSILEISCRRVSNKRYLSFESMFNSEEDLTKRLITSILSLAEFKKGNLCIFTSSDALMRSSNKSRIRFSILEYIPNLSPLGSLLPKE